MDMSDFDMSRRIYSSALGDFLEIEEFHAGHGDGKGRLVGIYLSDMAKDLVSLI